MKFSMIVLITSCEPNRAFKMPGIAPQTPPATIAATKHNGINSQAERWAKVMPTQAVAKAAT